MLQTVSFGLILTAALAAASPLGRQTTATAAATTATRAQRISVLRQAVINARDAVERATEQSPMPVIEIRQLVQAAYAELALDGDPAKAERLLRLAFSTQVTDTASPLYGSFPFRTGSPALVEDNGNEFETQAIGPLLLRFRRRFSSEFLAWLLPRVRAAAFAVARHKVAISYTNIFLMQSVNLALIGDALGDKELADDGYARLERWAEYTRTNGIHEFDSPTYDGISMESLFNGYDYVSRPQARKTLRKALDFFWADIAANYYLPRASLSGPHSRDYNFLRGGGALDPYLYVFGLPNSAPVQTVAADQIFSLDAAERAAYTPPADLLRLAANPAPREVRQRWGTEPGQDRVNYVTPDFSLGGASADYGQQDKLLVAELDGPRRSPVVSVVPDAYDEPYGTVKPLNRQGFTKPLHLPLGPTCVQDREALLALCAVDASKAKNAASIATNVLLPADAATILCGDEHITVSGPFTRDLKIGEVIGVRARNGSVAIRVFAADMQAGGGLELRADTAGLQNRAIRLVAYHARAAESGGERKLARLPVIKEPLRYGILLLAGRCPNDEALRALVKRAQTAAIQESVSGTVWQVKVVLPDDHRTLEAGADLSTRRPLFRRINGKEAAFPLLSVNGVDYAARAWKGEL